ncbi:MAG TPA: hypothetical protein VGP16_28100 [Asanoa sp.]|jgi:hypothetical protein|nr:hypothetical protein [Asanoa sp.]
MCTDAYREALTQAFLARESPTPPPSRRDGTEPDREGVDHDKAAEPREAVSR